MKSGIRLKYMKKTEYFSAAAYVYFFFCIVILISNSATFTKTQAFTVIIFIFIIYFCAYFISDIFFKKYYLTKKNLDYQILAKKFLLLIVFFMTNNILLKIIGVVSTNVKLISLCAAAPFFGEILFMRKILFFISLLFVNISMVKLSGSVNVFYLALYTISLLCYMFMISNKKLAENYPGLREKISVTDVRHFVVWLTFAMIIAVPFFIIIGNAGTAKKLLKIKEKDLITVKQTQKSIRTEAFLKLAIVAVLLIAVAAILKKFFSRYKKKQNIVEDKIEIELSRQGFTRELEKNYRPHYFFPKNNNGEILKKYETLILSVEKKTGSKLFNLTPLERIKKISAVFSGFENELLGLTDIFLKARYGDNEISDSEVLDFDNYLGKINEARS